MNIVILAAGMGKRMNSDMPKVLHPLAGKPLLRHVLDAAHSLRPVKVIVVYGHGAEKVRNYFEEPDGASSGTGGGPSIDWVLQSPQLGTGHAVAQAAPLR